MQDTLVVRALKAAQAGDRDACAFLYARYADDIYLHVRRFVGDHDEAQDVVQRVFARLMQMIGEERRDPFLPWALRVARNTAAEHVRARVSARSAPIEALEQPAPQLSSLSVLPMPR